MKKVLYALLAVLILAAVLAALRFSGVFRKSVPEAEDLPAPVETVAVSAEEGSDEKQDVPEPTPESTPEPTPEPSPVYELNFSVAGQQVTADLETINLTQASGEEIDRLISVLPALPKLREVELGFAAAENPVISWEQLKQLETGAPQAEIHYDFSVGGYPCSLSDSILNLNHIKFTDEGALAAQIAACMPNLELLDMDSCGVSNESMAQIRDSFPDVNVVWRVWFGTGYTVRTDAVKILASNPDRGGDLTSDAIDGLFYCNRVKYLDLGHNDKLSDISFVKNMPDLEVLIIAMTAVKDLSPLVNCPKLNFLEYFTCPAADLSPLSELTNLKDLHLCNDYALRDIRPLYGLDLDRLWIGLMDPIPKEQIDEYRRLHPNCVIFDGISERPKETEWRIEADYYPPQAVPRYAQLYEEFQYALGVGAYDYTNNDVREGSRFEYY